ncbi:MAG TPA: FAD-dependent oxidoreductase [Lacibacter sp.]|nr:FAD-dependent oxidoreductase [Lacibacter sp.]HMO89087.1 FAD-dependent oxidoreductase [Lacibacter sp.]HMP87753.1 FAD-dependent oxidoreductase [Lacibacter sp.]
MNAIVVGGGIAGLSAALYLQESGWEVTVLERGDFSDNCSYGNAGYVCPSHFVPLATPGIVRQGLKWMWNARSPFYVEPRLSWSLLRWGWRFMRVATPGHVRQSARPLLDIGLLSQACYENWRNIPGFDFAYEKKGLMEYFQTPEKEAHSHHMAEEALKLGLEAELLAATQVQAMEPQTRVNVKGALYFKGDAHLYPAKLMTGLQHVLRQRGVVLKPHSTVTSFDLKGGRVHTVRAGDHTYNADVVVLAAGAWSRELAAALAHPLLLVPGRGYSVTYQDAPFHLNYPAVLQEGRVAITPMDGNKIRFGGTMEITSTQTPVRLKRVEGILQAVQRYLPDFRVPAPAPDQVWYGYRPCSADGLPYIGKIRDNVIVATGHAMVGLSLGAGTGKLVAEIAGGQPASMDIRPFNPFRFS